MQSTMGYNKEVFEEIEFLKKENARLRRLLKKHGISPDELIENTIIQSQSASHPTSILSLDEKVALFRDIFSGREVGIVQAQARAVISRFVHVNGIESIAIRKNISVPNVQTVNFSH